MAADHDVSVPTHRHGAQRGLVLDGRMELTIDNHTRVFKRGETHFIPAGVEHGALLLGGCRGLFVFERLAATT